MPGNAVLSVGNLWGTPSPPGLVGFLWGADTQVAGRWPTRRIDGALTAYACGDALGVPWESAPRERRLPAAVDVAEQALRAGLRAGPQPVAHIGGQDQPPVRRTRYGSPASDGAQPAEATPAVVHRVIQRAVTAPVLRGQRQPGQRPHRPVRAQHRTASASSGRIELRVIDCGPGVPEADRYRMFAPFQWPLAGPPRALLFRVMVF